MGKPWGVRKLEWGGNWEGMRKGRSVYKQPGTRGDGIAPHKRRDSKYVKGNWQRGIKRDCAMM